MKKVVINSCFGGFNLSRKAMEWLYEHECPNITMPVDKYFGGDLKSAEVALKKWKDEKAFFVTYFTKDEKNVLCNDRVIPRDNKLLIQCIEELGSDVASGSCAKLKIVEIPDDVDFVIDEYDGSETIHEKHHSWS